METRMDLLDAPSSSVATLDRLRVVRPVGATETPVDAPDILVIDLAEATDPLRLCREVARQTPATAIIGVGDEDRLADGFQLLRLGAVSWAEDEVALGAVLDIVASGGSSIARRHASWLLADFAEIAGRQHHADPRYTVTATEREVLTRLGKGQTPEEIADFHDVETHLVNRQVRLALTRFHRRR
ncbi:MAG: hypothetical protein AAGK32_03740 [Actinomycetota bacterium]